MTMKPALILAFGIAAALVFVPAQGQTYQWKDSAGRTVIADTPPPGSAKEARTIGGQQRAVVTGENPAEKAAEGPKTTAEKDLDFKKRQQEAREKADKDAKEQKAAANRQENCQRARRNLAALEAKQPMALINEKGERQLMDDSQRQHEMERAREFIAEACK
jgi:hypothetical protein